MSVSDDHVDRLLRTVSPANRYDFVLAVIPIVFLLGGVVASVTSIPWRQAVVVAAAISTLFVADALFRNPPMEPGDGA